MNDDLVLRIRGARPRAVATSAARDRARAAALASAGPGARRRTARITLAVAGLAAVAAVAGALIAVTLAGGGDPAPRILLPGDDAPTARPAPARGRTGVRGEVILRPAGGADLDEAFEGFSRVVRARAKDAGRQAEVVRVDHDRVLVTLYGTRDSMDLQSIVSGASIAAYDLDRVLVGTFASLPGALRRAREVAPSAPARMAWYVRPGGAVRGPAPRASDLRTASMAAGARIMELPEGYAILRREYVRNARGDAIRLRPTEYLLVRDEPSVTATQVTGVAEQSTDQGLPGMPATVRLALTDEGRTAWDALLREAGSRAAATGTPQRVVVTTNGAVWQTVTADASGALDTRPGSPALEFGSFMSGSTGNGRRQPIWGDVPDGGSIPAVVWLAGVHPVGPPARVPGERVRPLPAAVRRAILAGPDTERGVPSTVRRAVTADGPDGEWSVWSYLTRAGSLRHVVVGPRPGDGFGFICRRRGAVAGCGGGPGFQVYAVAPAATALVVRLPSGPREADGVANGWALFVGPRRVTTAPGPVVRIEALDASGRVLGGVRERAILP
ncbi:MAG: hypothetical protein AB7V62_02105 [Thermoleophilia bacterium]